MTITRVGTNQKYATGWESAFTGKKPGSTATKNVAPDKSSKKKASPKKKASAPKKKAKK